MNSDYLVLALIAFCLLYWLAMRPPRHLSRAEYGEWYRSTYLHSIYWTTYSRLRRRFAWCAFWYKGGCSGSLQVHHYRWAYRYLFYEWLPWVTLFGTVVLCDKHHKRVK